jgi:hypothetical protein
METVMQWISQERPGIDRIAIPWLIARFIDETPDFLFVSPGDVIRIANETGAIPYDVPNVELARVGELCSFDALLDKFGLGGDPALQLMAGIVRGAVTSRLDLNPQSGGLHAISLGLSRIFTDDRELLEYGMVMYDALYAWCQSCQAAHGRPPQTPR